MATTPAKKLLSKRAQRFYRVLRCQTEAKIDKLWQVLCHAQKSRAQLTFSASAALDHGCLLLRRVESMTAKITLQAKRGAFDGENLARLLDYRNVCLSVRDRSAARAKELQTRSERLHKAEQGLVKSIFSLTHRSKLAYQRLSASKRLGRALLEGSEVSEIEDSAAVRIAKLGQG